MSQCPFTPPMSSDPAIQALSAALQNMWNYLTSPANLKNLLSQAIPNLGQTGSIVGDGTNIEVDTSGLISVVNHIGPGLLHAPVQPSVITVFVDGDITEAQIKVGGRDFGFDVRGHATSFTPTASPLGISLIPGFLTLITPDVMAGTITFDVDIPGYPGSDGKYYQLSVLDGTLSWQLGGLSIPSLPGSDSKIYTLIDYNGTMSWENLLILPDLPGHDGLTYDLKVTDGGMYWAQDNQEVPDNPSSDGKNYFLTVKDGVRTWMVEGGSC